MARKRKSSGQNPGKHTAHDTTKGDSRQTINTYEDVADSEDEFFINRDKVLLDEGPVQKKRRKTQEEGIYYIKCSRPCRGLTEKLSRCTSRALG